VKICLLESAVQDSDTTAKLQKICTGLKSLGYEVVKRECNASLLTNLRMDHPDVIFNLASIYTWGKANLIPAVLEIAGVDYTGSGILGLSLARNYTRLFPLLYNSGICLPAFAIIAAGCPLPDRLQYPLILLRDNLPDQLSLKNSEDLAWTFNQIPVGEEVLLLEKITGERVSIFILNNSPFLPTDQRPYLAAAQKVYGILEARGLARFDFICADKPVLEGVEIAPDPLDEKFLQAATLVGWNEDRVLQVLVQHSGRDHSSGA
jgi:hypothetical protein